METVRKLAFKSRLLVASWYLCYSDDLILDLTSFEVFLNCENENVLRKPSLLFVFLINLIRKLLYTKFKIIKWSRLVSQNWIIIQSPLNSNPLNTWIINEYNSLMVSQQLYCGFMKSLDNGILFNFLKRKLYCNFLFSFALLFVWIVQIREYLLTWR